jgi:hypothetical protein
LSFFVRHIVHSVDPKTQEAPSPVLWLLWLSIDAAWILVSNSLVAIMTQRDDITDQTAEIFRPASLVYMGDAEGGKATSVFLESFTEDQVLLSLSTEQPIFRKLPKSWSELIQWPHPINEIQNRLNAMLIGFVHLPLSIFLINYANFPWYLLALVISVLLRFCFAYRFEPQGWLVLVVSKFFDPMWAPGAPKRYARLKTTQLRYIWLSFFCFRFAAFMSVCTCVLCFALAIAQYKVLATWILAGHIVLSFNQMLGWCMGCGMFFMGTKLGLVPEEVCRRCMQRFVTETKPTNTRKSSRRRLPGQVGAAK